MYTFICLDGSAQVVDDVEIMSWSIAVFKVDSRMVHICVF